VIEPDEGVAAIGSGGSYAQAAARALLTHTNMTAAEIARAAMQIAASMCIYTNEHIILFSIEDANASGAPRANGSEAETAGMRSAPMPSTPVVPTTSRKESE
jgi:hypothetical protein